jgi:hypothetical protein
MIWLCTSHVVCHQETVSDHVFTAIHYLLCTYDNQERKKEKNGFQNSMLLMQHGIILLKCRKRFSPDLHGLDQPRITYY